LQNVIQAFTLMMYRPAQPILKRMAPDVISMMIAAHGSVKVVPDG